MANKTFTGSGKVALTDYKYIKVVGKTEAGSDIMIELDNAICTSNPALNFDDKTDVTPELAFVACYDDEKLEAGDLTEPWHITCDDALTAGNDEIVLGAARVYIGTSKMDAEQAGLVRGGAEFIIERDYRRQNADGDPGPVKGRIHLETSEPKITFHTFQWLTKMEKFWPAIKPEERA